MRIEAIKNSIINNPYSWRTFGSVHTIQDLLNKKDTGRFYEMYDILVEVLTFNDTTVFLIHREPLDEYYTVCFFTAQNTLYGGLCSFDSPEGFKVLDFSPIGAGIRYVR